MFGKFDKSSKFQITDEFSFFGGTVPLKLNTFQS